jgi:hypothetical protein
MDPLPAAQGFSPLIFNIGSYLDARVSRESRTPFLTDGSRWRLESRWQFQDRCAADTCERQTVGLLQRRHVQIDGIRYIGKESNALEEVEAGSFTPREAYTPNTAISKGMNGPPRS